MRFAPPHRRDRGFTLIELLIVVIILAILAAIVIPQFASTTGDAKEGALDANLSTMRSAIELYKVQHQNNYPGIVATGTAQTCGGDKGGTTTGAPAFIDQLTKASDANGNTCTVADTNYRFGPYFRGGLPSEAINGKADVEIATGGTPLAPTGTTGGWLFDTKSGQLVMNSSAKDIKGKAYSTH